jgi:aspartyl-tRNA(Asn)/glutamyl-tRNA(Gln) amidotransferase subunit C
MLSDDELRQLLSLSRLSVDEDVAHRLGEDVGRVLDWVKELDELDTEGVAPLVHPSELTQPRRADEARPVLGPRALDQASRTRDGMVEVPRIIEG